jgi:hypothetical protein
MTIDSPGGLPDRRTFIKTVGSAAAAVSANGWSAFAQTSPSAVRFGLDMFSVNQQNWTPFQQLDFAAKWKVKVVHFSEIRFLGSLEPDNLKRVRASADELNIDLEIGMRSICPSSRMFDKAQGTAEEQLGRMIDAAKIVRSPIVRAVLGSVADRAGASWRFATTASRCSNRRQIRRYQQPSGRSPMLKRASSGRRGFSPSCETENADC